MTTTELRRTRTAITTEIDLASLLEPTSQPSGPWNYPAAAPTRPHTTTPPVAVSVDHAGQQQWQCAHCAAGGTAIDLLTCTGTTTTGEAITRLTDIKRPSTRTETSRLPNPTCLAEHLGRCADLLWSYDGAPARDWLLWRSLLNEHCIRINGIDFDPGRQNLRRTRSRPEVGPAITFPLGPHDTVSMVARAIEDNATRRSGTPCLNLGGPAAVAWFTAPGNADQGAIVGANTGDSNCIVIPSVTDTTVAGTDTTLPDPTDETDTPEGPCAVSIELVLATIRHLESRNDYAARARQGTADSTSPEAAEPPASAAKSRLTSHPSLRTPRPNSANPTSGAAPDPTSSTASNSLCAHTNKSASASRTPQHRKRATSTGEANQSAPATSSSTATPYPSTTTATSASPSPPPNGSSHPKPATSSPPAPSPSTTSKPSDGSSNHRSNHA